MAQPAPAAQAGPAPAGLRPLRRTLGRLGREAALYPAVLAPGQGPRLAVLPSSGPEGASLLRGYNMAAALRRHGWQTVVLPVQLTQAQRQRLLARFRPDLLLVQQARHPLNRLAHLGAWPVVFDIDDADFLDPALTGELEALLGHALGAVCGSRYIRDWVARHTPQTRIIWTGTPIDPGPWPAHADRRPLVTWAQLGPERYVRELDFVAGVMAEVAQRRGGVDLRLYSWAGPQDHPALARMRAAGVRLTFQPRLDYAEYTASLREAAVGLSAIAPGEGFGQGKSFGKILGYLDAKVPVICSDAADHALFFRPATGVVSNDPAAWVAAVERLLDDADRRTAMAEAAHADLRARLSVAAAAARLHGFLTELLGRTAARATK